MLVWPPPGLARAPGHILIISPSQTTETHPRLDSRRMSPLPDPPRAPETRGHPLPRPRPLWSDSSPGFPILLCDGEIQSARPEACTFLSIILTSLPLMSPPWMWGRWSLCRGWGRISRGGGPECRGWSRTARSSPPGGSPPPRRQAEKYTASTLT